MKKTFQNMGTGNRFSKSSSIAQKTTARNDRRNCIKLNIFANKETISQKKLKNRKTEENPFEAIHSGDSYAEYIMILKVNNKIESKPIHGWAGGAMV